MLGLSPCLPCCTRVHPVPRVGTFYTDIKPTNVSVFSGLNGRLVTITLLLLLGTCLLQLVDFRTFLVLLQLQKFSCLCNRAMGFSYCVQTTGVCRCPLQRRVLSHRIHFEPVCPAHVSFSCLGSLCVCVGSLIFPGLQVRSGSRALYRPLSAAVLSRPEVKTEVSKRLSAPPPPFFYLFIFLTPCSGWKII